MTPATAAAATPVLPASARLEAIDGALPQTQCTRCGYPDCRRYALAIDAGLAPINRCPPGGAEGIARLSAITGLPILPLDPACGVEAPRRLAVIDEAACIGCTLCLKPCPVDCIVGGPKSLHAVIADLCTGCELCLPACPVDCIAMVELPGGATGWGAWSAKQADEARERYAFHQFRLERDERERIAQLESSTATPAGHEARAASAEQAQQTGVPADAAAPDRKRAVIEAALARARAARSA